VKHWLCLLPLLAACTPEQPPADVPAGPVVVYTAFEDDARLAQLLTRYTDETGITVILRQGPAARIVDDVIANRVTPPADLLLTASVADAWRAAEEGALRPVYSEDVRARVPEWARDADELWFATAFDRVVIVHDGSRPDLPGDLAGLAEPDWAGELCLSSSQLAINRAMLAMMIGELGERPAELVVRGWVANLAVAPLATEAGLVAELAAGTCSTGIVSAAAAVDNELEIYAAQPVYGDAATLGVGRHAHNPDGAVVLAEWLLAEAGPLPERADRHPQPGELSLVGREYDAAGLLAERARYP